MYQHHIIIVFNLFNKVFDLQISIKYYLLLQKPILLQ